MVIVISASERGAIEEPSKIEYFENMLLRLDKNRFRGLGKENTHKFIRNAMKFCDLHGYKGTDEYGYIMFLMSYLGSYFFTDPRYKPIYTPLISEPDLRIDRIALAQEEFQSFAAKYIGADHALVKQSVDRFRPIFNQRINENYDCFQAVRDLQSSANGASHITREDWEEFIHLSVSEPMNLWNYKEARTSYFFAVFAFFLGVGFYKDPLFPWIRDTKKDRDSETEHVNALVNFIKKRIG